MDMMNAMMQMAMQRMGTQNFQQQLNQMQQEAQQMGMTPQQYAMYKIQNGACPQDAFNGVMNGINGIQNGRR